MFRLKSCHASKKLPLHATFLPFRFLAEKQTHRRFNKRFKNHFRCACFHFPQSLQSVRAFTAAVKHPEVVEVMVTWVWLRSTGVVRGKGLLLRLLTLCLSAAPPQPSWWALCSPWPTTASSPPCWPSSSPPPDSPAGEERKRRRSTLTTRKVRVKEREWVSGHVFFHTRTRVMWVSCCL